MSVAVPPVPNDPDARHRYQLETFAMVDELERCIFPPWRWLEWRRLARLIRARNQAMRASLEVARLKSGG